MYETCKHVFKTGARKGQMCGKRGKHVDGTCSDHFGAKKKPRETSLVNDEVFGTPGAVAAPKAPKTKSSVWLITLNSQKDINVMSNDQKRMFKDFAEWVFDKDRFAQFYLKDMNSPADPTKNIKSLDIKYQFEVGNEQGRLHIHALVNLKHTGMYRFEANKLRTFAKTALGYGVYLDSPVRSDEVSAMDEYVNKSHQVVTV